MGMWEEVGYYGDFATTRREVWGCCEGSNTRWMAGVYCDRFNSFVDACEELPECQLQNDGYCVWRPPALMDLYFGPGQLSDALAATATECAARSGSGRRAECEAAHMVYPDGLIVQAALGIDLAAINMLVNESDCVVWESGEYV